MTRSRRRKLQRLATSRRQDGASYSKTLIAGVPLAPMLLAAPRVALAQQTSAGGLEEIIVTARKREENLQAVPISIQALGEERLSDLKVSEFRDYVKLLPSSAFTSAGPVFSLPYFRGVASGENNNHSGPSPSVGIYLDEQPITTITGALDVHIYDIARVEALAGPQGTLFGASSQAGTIRIITNQPDPSGFEAGYGVEGNYVQEGDAGYLFEPLFHLGMLCADFLIDPFDAHLDRGQAAAEPSESGALNAKATGQFEDLDVGLVFRSVGYRGVPLPGVPFHERWGVILNEQGRVVDPESKQPLPGQYTAGWIKRGPSGVIGTNKPDAVETVNCMLEDLAAGRVFQPACPDAAEAERLIAARQPAYFTFADWLKLDALELANGQAAGRPRLKFTRVEEMLQALGR